MKMSNANFGGMAIEFLPMDYCFFVLTALLDSICAPNNTHEVTLFTTVVISSKKMTNNVQNALHFPS